MSKSLKIIIIVVIIIIGIISISKFKNNKIEQTTNIRKNNTSIDYRVNDNGDYVIYDTKTNQVIDNVENSGEVKLYEDNPNYNDFAPKDLKEVLENNENLVDVQ